MAWLQYIKAFFNNQSVGAFVGAFCACVLVVLNDRRRDGRKVKNLSAEIEMSLAHAKGKLESVRSNRALMREHNRVMAAPILAFGIGSVAVWFRHYDLHDEAGIDADFLHWAPRLAPREDGEECLPNHWS